MSLSVAIALVALTIAAFINSLGLILMKMGLIEKERQPESNVIFKPKYMGGVCCLIIGALILVGKKRYFFLNFLL
jgi:hypothetical protein